MKRRSWAVAVVGATVVALLPSGGALAGGFCSGHEGERLSDARGTRVTMSSNCFHPTVLRVGKGTTVTFVNKDPEEHTVGGTAGTFGEMHAAIRVGRSVSYRFEREGIFPYVCLIHPGMAGAIVVGDGVGPAVATAAPVASERPAETSSVRDDEGVRSELRLGALAGVAAVVLALGWALRRFTARHQGAGRA